MLSDAERKQLLTIARKAIEERVRYGRSYDAALDPETPGFTDLLEKESGSFVTLRKGGELRGCIGLIEGITPLYQAVQEMAVAAAVQDPRFPPTRLEDLGDLYLEISVLSPLKEISSLKEVEVGRHGIFIRRGMNSGLLLPQVATEHNWELEEFVRNTCYKAGLNPDSWKRHRRDPEMHIFIFSAEVFGSPFEEA